MSWSKLAPVLKSTGRPMVSASIVVNKDGASKINLVLSASIHDEYGARLKADVSAGQDEDAGSLLVEFDPAGAFDVKPFAKGGARIFVPTPDDVPAAAASNVACVLGARSNDSFVVKLPVEAWRREIEARKPRAPGGGQPATAPTPPKPPLNGQPLDMVEYLRGKGVAIQRLAGNRFQLDGEVVQAAAVLKRVNEHRDKAGLDPLPHSKVL